MRKPTAFRRIRRMTVHVVLTTAAVAAGALGVTAPAAYAASASACAAAPSTQNCDHVDPASGGGICLGNSWRVYSFAPTNDAGKPVDARVELWWSQTCRSNWARIVSTGYVGGAEIDLWRDPDRTLESYFHWMTATGTYSVMYTDMLYGDSPYTTAACASDNSGWGGCGAYV